MFFKTFSIGKLIQHSVLLYCLIYTLCIIIFKLKDNFYSIKVIVPQIIELSSKPLCHIVLVFYDPKINVVFLVTITNINKKNVLNIFLDIFVGF